MPTLKSPRAEAHAVVNFWSGHRSKVNSSTVSQMGIYDRDYMRRDRPTGRRPAIAGPPKRYWWWVGGGFLVCLLVFASVRSRLSEWNQPIFEPAPELPSSSTRPDSSLKPLTISRSEQRRTASRIRRININTASFVEISNLPQVSPTIAQSIIDNRPYQSVADLTRAWGIGPKRLSLLKRYVTAGAAETNRPSELPSKASQDHSGSDKLD